MSFAPPPTPFTIGVYNQTQALLRLTVAESVEVHQSKIKQSKIKKSTNSKACKANIAKTEQAIVVKTEQVNIVKTEQANIVKTEPPHTKTQPKSPSTGTRTLLTTKSKIYIYNQLVQVRLVLNQLYIYIDRSKNLDQIFLFLSIFSLKNLLFIFIYFISFLVQYPPQSNYIIISQGVDILAIAFVAFMATSKKRSIVLNPPLSNIYIHICPIPAQVPVAQRMN